MLSLLLILFTNAVIFLDEFHLRKLKSEKRRLEATSIVMFGVIGSVFGNEQEFSDVTFGWHTS